MQQKVWNRALYPSRRFAVYLVRGPAGHAIMPHLDMVTDGRVYRLSCVLAKPRLGDVLWCEKSILNLIGRVVIFRPELYRHEHRGSSERVTGDSALPGLGPDCR